MSSDEDPIEQKLNKLLFQKNDSETKLKILRDLNPLKLNTKELLKAVDYFRGSLKKINLDSNHYGFTGTGGDVYKTINATVLACLVASCDIKICKVGSIGVTSRWGSLDLLKEMGYKFPSNATAFKEQIEKYNFCFVSPSVLGIPYNNELVKARQFLYQEGSYDILKIIFPASFLMEPKLQITGVYDKKLIPSVIEIFKHLKGNGIIVHCYDGIDELSNTSKNIIVEVQEGKVREYEIEPKDLNINKAKPEDIAEFDNLKEQTECSWDILSGKEKGPKRDFVVINSALLLYLAKKVTTLKEGIDKANQLIENGVVYANVKKLLSE